MDSWWGRWGKNKKRGRCFFCGNLCEKEDEHRRMCHTCRRKKLWKLLLADFSSNLHPTAGITRRIWAALQGWGQRCGEGKQAPAWLLVCAVLPHSSSTDSCAAKWRRWTPSSAYKSVPTMGVLNLLGDLLRKSNKTNSWGKSTCTQILASNFGEINGLPKAHSWSPRGTWPPPLSPASLSGASMTALSSAATSSHTWPLRAWNVDGLNRAVLWVQSAHWILKTSYEKRMKMSQ